MKEYDNTTSYFKSFYYAFNGIITAAKQEQNLWFHLDAVIVVTGLGWYFELSRIEWISIILCFGLVISAELLNSAIERIVDLISPEYNPKAGIIKDIAAGAVLFAAIISIIVGLIVFIPKIY